MKVNNVQTYSYSNTYRPLFKSEKPVSCQPLRDEFRSAEQLSEFVNRNSRKRIQEVLLHALYGAGIGALFTLILFRK